MVRRSLIEGVAVIAAALVLVGLLAVLRRAPPVAVGTDRWTVAWAAATEPAVAAAEAVATTFPAGRARDQSVREAITLSVGGRAVRARLTNHYGEAPLVVSHATVVERRADGSIDGAHVHDLAFAGQGGIVVGAGADAVSDPVGLPVGAGEELAVTLTIAGPSPSPTLHEWGAHATGVAPPGSGDHAADRGDAAFVGHTTAVYWLAAVEALNPPGAAHALIALGDSLTDAYRLDGGIGSWPDLLGQATRRAGVKGFAVIDEGLAGNTVTDVGCAVCGEELVQRVIRDAVDLPGADRAIVLEGTNDIVRGASAAAIVHGLASVAAILRFHHLKAIAMTIPPRQDRALGWDATTMEPVRRAVNGWLRGSHEFDALVDADALLADPIRRADLSARYALGDGLDLNAAGRALVSDSVAALGPGLTR